MTTKRYAGWPASCIAVSGLANPAQFEHQLSRQCRVLSHFAYPDHHTFTEDDLREWAAALKKETAVRRPEANITTEKDAERIRPLEAAADLPILVVNLKIQWWDEEPPRRIVEFPYGARLACRGMARIFEACATPCSPSPRWA